MRILDTGTGKRDIRDLAMTPHNLEIFSRNYTKPYGMILVTGPTGSGKSTTLYTTLATVARPEINVITVEDPVEFRMPGINQVQVNPKAGLTFASAPALHPPLRPRCGPHRRDPGSGDRADRDRGGADRSPRAQHAAHETTPRAR